MPLLLGSCFLGCGEGGQETITGKVTFQGRPVTQGNITFSGSEPTDVAQGRIGDEGVYVLWQMGDGLTPGEYRVTITPLRIEKEVVGRDSVLVLVGEESIPRNYRQKRTTPLKVTVTGGADTFDFDMLPGAR